MKFLLQSIPTQKKHINDNDKTEIHVFSQFFIHDDKQRRDEITFCLKNNNSNVDITKIHLLNERIYTDDEMGVENSSKIIQTDIKHRIKFKDVFSYIRINNIQGYLVFVNIDIFFDDSLKNLFKSQIDEKKKMFALLRYEYNGRNTETSKIFGPRSDSQDTWIFHSNTIITMEEEKIFSFEFGMPGCDNKFIYLMKILGYDVINDPSFIKTYHNHRSNIRNYGVKDVVPPPYGWISPSGFEDKQILDVNIEDMKKENIWFNDNDRIREYISSKLEHNSRFIIPRVAGIENNFAVYKEIYPLCSQKNKRYIESYFINVSRTMKNNAGIMISNINSVELYSQMYLKAFENCDLYCGWEMNGACYPHIKESHDYIKKRFVTKKMVWAYALDVFHYVHSNPWTQALKGKRILIISPFEETIREQLPHREKLYGGVDLFPDCKFVTIKPPMTQGSENSREFYEELADFYMRLDKMKNLYDVALLSCGGYGNIISNYIFTEHEKSAIYMGGTLQMAFGILGKRWLLERPDIVRLYMNEYWTHSKDTEKPQGFENIEGGCYW
jgi:hypothetical protein